MAQKDEKKEVTFVDDETLNPAIEKMLEGKTEEGETVEVIITTKGYENRKDPKMTVEVAFPNRIRMNHKMCVIGDENAKVKAEEAGLPFALMSEYEGKTPEMVKKREKFIRQHGTFICCPGSVKVFPLKEILMKKKTTFTCQNVDQFSTLYERLLKTYKLRVKDWYSVAFPAGHTGLTNDQIKDNLKESIQFISGKFKKGAANIKHCFIKRAHGETVKLY